MEGDAKGSAVRLASDFRLIELHSAALRLISVTGTKSLWSAIDAVGAGMSAPRETKTVVDPER